MKIVSVTGYRRFDSRGNPTVQAIVETEDGVKAKALVPSGASTGVHEALELRDGGDSFQGKDVIKAVGNIKKIGESLRGMDVTNQSEIDKKMLEMDGTENKQNLGANAILAVSLACARVAAQTKKQPLFEYIASTYGFTEPSTLPVPMMNVINGGAHAGWEGTDFQEYMIVPHGAASFSEAFRWGVETYHTLREILKQKKHATQVGDEGGFVPSIDSNEEAVELVLAAIRQAGFKPGEDISIALDPAVSAFYNSETHVYDIRTERRYVPKEDMMYLWKDWVEKYPIVSLEDGLGEDDWDGWTKLTSLLGNKIQIVGDDFLVTNKERVQKAINRHSANSLLVKVNQIGTLTETIEAIQLCHDNGWKTVVSHRSGETEDSFIADLVVATGASQIKTGAPARSDRVAKYNRLLDIEEYELPRLSREPQFAKPFTR